MEIILLKFIDIQIIGKYIDIKAGIAWKYNSIESY